MDLKNIVKRIYIMKRIYKLRACALFAWSLGMLVPVVAQTQPVQSYALNPYVSVLDGQWLGIKYASDGNVYFASSTRSAHHGAAFFKYTSSTGQVTMLIDDITKICGENPLTNPQGKIHSDIVEANGWLYFSTFFANEAVPGAYSTYTGSHVIGYQLSTGNFRDYGVVLPNYTSYSGITVDPVRNYIYVFLTGENPGQASYMFRIDAITGAKTNLGQVGGTFASCFYLFLDQRGDVWFSVEYGGGSLQRVHGDTGVIETYTNVLPPLYLWNQPIIDPSSSNQALRSIHWMQPLDGNRAVFTEGYYGGMVYIFDSSKVIGSGQEFSALQHIGYTDLGLALGNNRVFYHQRANRGCGHQGDGQQISICGPPPPGGVMDFHLLSVSLNPADNYAITDYGLLQDQNGRLLWRAPGITTDRNNRVFLVGDWYTIAGEAGSLRYMYDPATGTESYVPLNRGEFFAVANISAPAISITPPRVTLDSSQTQQFTATVQDPRDQPVIWSISGAGSISTSGFYIAPASVSTNQTVAVTATSPFNGARSATATVNLNKLAGSGVATFVSEDKTTHGTWKGVYGVDGFTIAGDTASLPGYAQAGMSGQLPYTWVSSTQDVNCLQKGAVQAADRIASVWYSGSSFTIDVTIGGVAHPVALYALDWDGANRVERIDVVDVSSGLQLDSRTISGFSTGTYLLWNIKGHVQFRITRVSGPNAIISGIFFGGSQGTVVQPAITQNPANAAVNAGQTATFTVAASGGNLGYQWQWQPSGSASFSNITGANNISYTTAALTSVDSGTQFRCVVTNSAGSATSAASILTVTLSAPTITQNPANAAATVGRTASFMVAASGSNLTYQWQSQPSGGSSFSNIFNANAATYTTLVLALADNGTQLRCVVTNGGGLATSSAATLTVTAPSASSASFVSADTTTRGSWKGTYGSDGFQIASDLTSLPSYAQVALTGQSPYVWSPSTQDVNCLQKGAPTATDRLAAVWYSGSSFTIDVNLSGGAHPVAIYALDWDQAQRSERIDVLDAASGVRLDTRTVSGFSSGTYLVWNVTGHVQFRVTRVGGPNAIASGIFFGTGQAVVIPPSITQNPANASVNAGQTATFTVAAVGSALTYQWQSQASGATSFSNITDAINATYTTPALNLPNTGTQFRCVVSNSAASATSTSAAVTVTTVSTGSSAVYVTLDGTTQGAWKPTYGADGYAIAAVANLYPSYAQVAITGATLWSSSLSTDPRAMQVAPGIGQIACWFASPQFIVDLNLTDANTHRIALYFMDWGGSSRNQTVTIRDWATNSVLDTRTLSSFLNGQYLIWNVHGHVTVSISLNSGPNAVLSGLFFQ